MVFSGELITIEDSDGEYETSADEQPTRKQNPARNTNRGRKRARSETSEDFNVNTTTSKHPRPVGRPRLQEPPKPITHNRSSHFLTLFTSGTLFGVASAVDKFPPPGPQVALAYQVPNTVADRRIIKEALDPTRTHFYELLYSIGVFDTGCPESDRKADYHTQWVNMQLELEIQWAGQERIDIAPMLKHIVRWRRTDGWNNYRLSSV